jgi:alkylation response protein AidB-like acyl-CoA dehydrogenase
MNVLRTSDADATAHPEAPKPEREATVQNGVWGADPSRRYDHLAAPFRPIFRRIREGAAQRERNRVLPFAEIQWLKEAGFGAVRAPKEHGGRSATLPELFALLAELAEADSNLTQALRVHFAYVEDVLNSQDQARRERWFKRIANGDNIGGAWTEIGEAKMASFSTRVSANNGRLTLTGAKYYTTAPFPPIGSTSAP